MAHRGIICEVYAYHIALPIMHWATVLTIWYNPTTSLPRGARRVKAWAVPFLVCGRLLATAAALPCLEQVLRRARPIAAGQFALEIYQLLLYPSPFPIPLHLRLPHNLSLKSTL